MDYQKLILALQNMQPDQMDMLAGELARNPQMAPPQIGPGGFKGIMDQMLAMAGQQDPSAMVTDPQGAVTSPLAGPQGPGAPAAPVAGATSLGQLLNMQAQPMADPMAPAAAPVDPNRMAAALGALQGPEQAPAPRQAPFLSNVISGGGSPAQPLPQTSLVNPGLPPTLGQLLAQARGR